MIRLAVSATLILSGLFVLAVATLGLFRFESVLNRIHVAAKCDTLGALTVLFGLMVLGGMGSFSFKLVLVIIFLGMANPTVGHLIARAEMATNERLRETCGLLDIDELKAPSESSEAPDSPRKARD